MSQSPTSEVSKTFRTDIKRARPIRGTRARVAATHRPAEERTPIRVPLSRDTIEGRLSSGTSARDTKGPERGEDPVVFPVYTPQDRPKDTSIVNHIPPDPSGDDSEPGIVLQTGNDYLRYSNDNGATFTMLANTAVIKGDFAGGEHGDQVMIFAPSIQCFIWYLQYNPDPATNDGAFRIAYATLADLQTKVQGVWKVYDWLATDFGLGGTDFDFPDVTVTETFLYATTGTGSAGRLFMRFSLADLAAGSVAAQYTGLLSITAAADKSQDTLRYANFCQSARDRGLWAGHVDNSTLRIFEWLDAANAFSTHDVKTVTWPNTSDYASACPDGTDWLANGGDAEISAFARRNDELWLGWTASRGQATPSGPDYKHPHVRVATVRMSDWTETAEMQVWNPDYAFAFADLNINRAGDVGIGLAFGGPSNFADAAFGIIGDFVVWYQDASDAAFSRWGDYLTVRRNSRRGNWFGGFGYFTLKDSKAPGGRYQKPYYVQFARKSQT